MTVTASASEQELTNTFSGVLKESSRITPEDTDEVRQLLLRVDEPAFRFVEGQTIGVLVPGPHAFGNAFHHRRYSIANARDLEGGEGADLEILVRRCFYVDEVSGERYPGIASNYLCDAKPGERIQLSGPYRSPFKLPSSDKNNLLMIGTGTGIAPFRAFVQHIYSQHKQWQGQVRLFYGGKSGMDLAYMNEQNGDLANYYDEATFKAFKALSPRPLASAADGVEDSIEAHADEVWSLLNDANTHVYLAGTEKIAEAFRQAMIQRAGSDEAWARLRKRLVDDNRWSELFYQ